MAEEIHNANVVIPWCILSTTILNGLLGFAMIVAMLFVTVDIDSVLESPTGKLGYPFMQVFYDATGSISGASTMICIIIIMMLCATIAFLATSSRIVFAFGRDRGLPFSQTMAKVCYLALLIVSWVELIKIILGRIQKRYPDVCDNCHGWGFMSDWTDQHRFRNRLQRRDLTWC